MTAKREQISFPVKAQSIFNNFDFYGYFNRNRLALISCGSKFIPLNRLDGLLVLVKCRRLETLTQPFRHGAHYMQVIRFAIGSYDKSHNRYAAIELIIPR